MKRNLHRERVLENYCSPGDSEESLQYHSSKVSTDQRLLVITAKKKEN